MMPTWIEAGQKIDFFVQRADFSVIVNISVKTFWRHAIHAIFACFQIIMVSLFLARHDQYLMMFNDSNIFEFTNSSFPTKFFLLTTIIYSRQNKKKTVVTILWLNLLYLLIFRKNSMNFEGSPILIHWRVLISLEN